MVPMLWDRVRAAAKILRQGDGGSIPRPPVTSSWHEAWGLEASAIEPATADYYRVSVAVYACVKLRADNVARVPFVVLQDGEAVEPDHPLQALLEAVNPFWTAARLREATEIALNLWGSAFWLLQRGERGGLPREIWWLRPDRVRIVPDPANYIKGFLYSVDGREFSFGPSEVIWLANFNPYSELQGLSPLEAARLSIEANTEAMRWNRRFFQNDATPGRVWAKFDSALSPEQADELQARWAAAHRGTNRAHRLAILSGGGELHTLGIPQRDMEFLGLQRFTLEDICRIYRVPPPMVGDLERATYSNMKEAKQSLWHETILPEVRMVCATLTEFLAPLFGPGLAVSFDVADIEALQEDAALQATRLQGYIDRGVLTINEVREQLGREPVPWGSRWWAPLALMPVSASGLKPPPAPTQEGLQQLAAELEYTEGETRTLEGHARSLDRNAQGLRRFFQEVFTGQETRALEQLRLRQQQVRDEGIFSASTEAEEMARLSRPVIEELVGRVAAEKIQQFGLAISFDLRNPRVQTWIGNRIKQFSRDINATTAEAITAQLREAELAGEGIPEMVARLRSVFDDARGFRLERIARTEVIGASNRAAHESYIQSGVVDEKMWLTAMDGREREAHGAAHRQVRRLADAFDVGGEAVMHPGEGSAANAVNCRCVEVPVITRRGTAHREEGHETRCPVCGNFLGEDVRGRPYCERCRQLVVTSPPGGA